MKQYLIILLTCFTLTSYSQDTTSLEYAEVFYEGAWRIINKQGEFILDQKFGVGAYQQLCFGDKLVVSQHDKKFGFTNFSNNQVIPNKFDVVQCFVLGYAPAALNGKWGIIDRSGVFVVEPVYDYVGTYCKEGVAPVIKDKKIALVDTTGKLICPFRYYWMSSPLSHPDIPFFINGLITVYQTDDPEDFRAAKAGCMNAKGDLVIPADYDFISYFSNGVAAAGKENKTLLIDTLGNIVLELNDEVAGSLFFEDGYSTFQNTEGKTGMIKLNGDIILEAKYNGINPFSEGFAAVQISGDEKGVKSAFADTSGKFVFDRTFGFIRDFNEGYAAVEINDKWGFIDRTGKMVIDAKYAAVYDFHEGIAVVGVQTGKVVKYGYIDTTGKMLLPAIYNEAKYFENGLAPVKIGKKFGFIDKTGKTIIRPEFENAFGFRTVTLGWIE